MGERKGKKKNEGDNNDLNFKILYYRVKRIRGSKFVRVFWMWYEHLMGKKI